MIKGNFLNLKQVKILEGKQWKVKPKGFFVILYNDDFKGNGWSDICKIAGVNPKTTSTLKLLCHGTAVK